MLVETSIAKCWITAPQHKDLDNELICMAMVCSLGDEYSHFASSLLLFQSLEKERLKEAFLAEELQCKHHPESTTASVYTGAKIWSRLSPTTWLRRPSALRRVVMLQTRPLTCLAPLSPLQMHPLVPRLPPRLWNLQEMQVFIPLITPPLCTLSNSMLTSIGMQTLALLI